MPFNRKTELGAKERVEHEDLKLVDCSEIYAQINLIRISNQISASVIDSQIYRFFEFGEVDRLNIRFDIWFSFSLIKIWKIDFRSLF